MLEKDSHEYYSELSAKYLSGNASVAEVQELESWVSAKSENKEQFVEDKKVWLLTQIEQNRQAIDVAEQWKQMQAQLSKKEAKTVSMQPKKQRTKWWSIAATIALVLVGSWVYFTYFKTNEIYIVNQENEPQQIELSDGSKVILNQAATLRFTIGEQRKVELTGDAFFDVKRDENLPFVIQADEVEVEVLGTSFYVDSRAQETAIEVIVESGKVAVRAKGQEQILNPNEQAVYSKVNQSLAKQNNEDQNFNSLKTNILKFENANLEEVVSTLERQYNADIRLTSEALKECEIDATFKDKSLDAVLAILSSTFGIEVTQRNEEIILSGVCSVE
ncbi:MAG: FecR domain-containing protein [Bacteroidota bacterium]